MSTMHVYNKVKRALSLAAAAVVALLLAACDDGAHLGEYPLPEGQGAMVVGLESRAGVSGVALYLFGDGGATALHKSYDDPRGLASEYFPLRAGSYTVIVVANAGGAVLPEDTTVPDLVEWGDIERLHLVLTDGTSGIHLSTVRLALTVPGLDLPAYATRANGSDSKPLRCVAEVYQAGTSNRVHRRVQDCSLQSDGTFLAELSLMPGDYDLRLWADWDGGYYNTDDLGKVLVLTDNYVANGETDKKDAYYATSSLSIPSSPTGGVEGASVSLERPFAKYRLIATDVEAYYNLIEKGRSPASH